MNFLEENYTYLYKRYSESPFSDKIEAITNVNKKLQFWFILVVTIYYLAFGLAIKYFSLVFSMLYPGFQSFIALESAEAGEQRRMLLTYWIVISCITTLENIAWFAVAMIPLYYLLKVFVVYWLISPETKGCMYIYQNILEPQLKRNRIKIETFLNNTGNSLTNMSSKITNNINDDTKIN